MFHLPQFVIIGAQKAGSTFLHEALRQHPGLFLPRYETPVFEDPFYVEDQVQARLNDVLASARPGQIRGIKRPDYLGRPECPARLARHLPQARLVVTLRHPVMRAISAYFWYMQVGILPARPLQQGMADLLDGVSARRIPKAQEVLSYGLYHQHLQRYGQYFASQQMFILSDMELRADAGGALQRLFTFLQAEPAVEVDLSRRPKQAIYALPRLRWLAWANQRFFYDNWLDAHKMIVLAQKESRLSRLAYYACVVIDRLALQPLFANDAPALEPALAQALNDYYRQDVLALQALINKDLSQWLQAPGTRRSSNLENQLSRRS